MINTSFDPLGRETGQTWISGGSTVNVFTFTYDPADNQLTADNYNGAYTMGYDALNRMTSDQEPFGLLLTFSYDANDNRTLVQDSFGGLLTSQYDSLDRVTTREIAGATVGTLMFDLAYNSRNDITNVTRYSNLAGTATVGYSADSYDAANRVTNIQHQNGSGSVLANFTYTYDSGSRLTSEDANGSTRTFQYDKANELTSDGVNSYAYDLNGNTTRMILQLSAYLSKLSCPGPACGGAGRGKGRTARKNGRPGIRRIPGRQGSCPSRKLCWAA